MTTIMCFGTFDILHLGHIYYFQQAKKYADTLIVVVARDRTKQEQRKETIFTEEERLQLVRSLVLVDEAVLGNEGDHFRIIVERKPEVICLGYDHPVKEKELTEYLLQHKLHPTIVRAKPYKAEKYKTSRIRDFILSSR